MVQGACIRKVKVATVANFIFHLHFRRQIRSAPGEAGGRPLPLSAELDGDGGRDSRALSG